MNRALNCTREMAEKHLGKYLLIISCKDLHQYLRLVLAYNTVITFD